MSDEGAARVLMIRLDALKDAITARDQEQIEFQFDRVLSSASKISGTRDREVDRVRAEEERSPEEMMLDLVARCGGRELTVHTVTGYDAPNRFCVHPGSVQDDEFRAPTLLEALGLAVAAMETRRHLQ